MRIYIVFILFLFGCKGSQYLSDVEFKAIEEKGIVFSIRPIDVSTIPANSGINIADSLKPQISRELYGTNLGNAVWIVCLKEADYLRIYATNGKLKYWQKFQLAKGFHVIINENSSLALSSYSFKFNGTEFDTVGQP